jgi:site-specific recombinase XerD
MHSLRHFAATEMLAAGVDIRQVADTLGHADGGTLALQVYTHPTSDRQRAAAAAMAAALMP